jgi:hypothetical protein
MLGVGGAVGFAVAAGVVLFVAAGGGTARGNSLIVFPASPGEGQAAQLYSILPTGEGLKQITTGANAALDPVFSPGGKRIAFQRFDVGLFTVNPDGSGLRRLTTNGRDAFPTWSPSGNQIAFVRPIGSKWRLYVMSPATRKLRRLGQAPPAGRPSWTKAGLLVPTGGDLVRVDPKNGRVLKYYDASIDAIWGLNSVTISPTISQLTYVGARASDPGDMECGEGACQRFGLFGESLTAKKKRPKLLVKDAGPAVFSPDGRQMAFVAGGSLVLRSATSSRQTSLATPSVTPVTTGPPAWR